MSRRTFLVSIGSFLSVSISGCSNLVSKPAGKVENKSPTEENRDENTSREDLDPRSIHGRIHNEDDGTHLFEIETENKEWEESVENALEVTGNSTRNVPAVARPGETLTFDVTVDETRDRKTIEFDIEPSPPQMVGYVHFRYEPVQGITISFEPADSAI